MRPFLNSTLLLLVLLCGGISIFNFGNSPLLVYGEDTIEGEDEADIVEDEIEKEAEDETIAEAEEQAEPEPEDEPLKPSPFAETNLLFQNFVDHQLTAGHTVTTLVGFRNKGEDTFTIDYINAALKYSQDYSYTIQNFTAFKYEKQVEPSTEATFMYAFHLHDSFGGRPFGLTLQVMYKDSNKTFIDAVFNETITILEYESGFDGETFFLYVFFLALCVLFVIGGYHLVGSGKKRSFTTKKRVEMGTHENSSGVDLDWIPKENLTVNRKSKVVHRKKKSGAVSSSGDEAL